LPDIDDLKFVRITDPNLFALIPRQLFEQIRARDWEVDTLYRYGPLFVTNQFNLFWVMTDTTNVIKGVLWATIDPVVKAIAVNIVSVDREFQKINGSLRKSQSELLLKVKEHLQVYREELKKKSGFELKDKILWGTTRPKAFERSGAKRYRTVMEV